MRLNIILICAASLVFCHQANSDAHIINPKPRPEANELAFLSPSQTTKAPNSEQLVNGSQVVLPGVENTVQQTIPVNNTYDCEQPILSISFQPLQYGVARWSVEQVPVQCKTLMMLSRYSIYYTWTSTATVEPGTYEKLQYSWYLDSTSLEEWHETKAYVNIDGIYFEGGLISISSLAPPTTSGRLQLQLKRDDGSTDQQNLSGTIQGDGPYTAYNTVAFSRTKISKGNYIESRVRWIASDSVSSTSFVIDSVANVFLSPWRVLGIIKYTQYNAPDESACRGTPVAVWVVDNMVSCNFTSTTMVSKFASQVGINGTGKSLSYGLVKAGPATDLARRCRGRFPSGANLENSFLQVPSVTGSCNRVLIPYAPGVNSSIATPPEYATPCDRIFTLVNKSTDKTEGFRYRHDTCPLCSAPVSGVDGHIDQYSSAVACSGHGVGDFGNYWTSLFIY